MVPGVGLEPTRCIAPKDFKSFASTNSATRACLTAKCLPFSVFAFALKDNSPYTVFDLSDKLRERGWQVPAYTMPPDADDISVLRVVVREGFSRDLADMFVEDLQRAVDHVGGRQGTAKKRTVFSH